MVGWHHQLNGHEFEQALRVGDALEPSHPLSPLLLLPSIFPSIRVFSNESDFESGSQRTRVSSSASVCSMNTQD